MYRHFTQYVFSQPKERLKWGYRRIVGYINLYATVKSLLEKKAQGITDYTAESAFLQGAAAAQEGMVAVQIVAAIAVGAAVTSVIFRALAQRGKREANSPKDAA